MDLPRLHQSVSSRTPREPQPRLAVISLHTSPLDQPGTGDAGGMNVYIVEVARRLAQAGVEVEVFTRATASDLPPVVEPTSPTLPTFFPPEQVAQLKIRVLASVLDPDSASM